ncbi:zinc carboxypeptidase-like [Uranotaenia lowii]|uniref:zinc carboxypeptidase-like n=1 Tax=Uranotaenia lowii TaxID=190385 RepID=UPI00247AD6AE|nr:zinc carboxypeptidase-like [Uranotaenia lowii]
MMFKICVVLGLLAAVCTVNGEKLRFDNYRSYEVNIQNEEQLRALQTLEESPNGYYFLESPMRSNMKVSILVPPHKYADFENFTSHLDMENSLKIANFQELIDNERPLKRKREGFGWEDYHTLEEMYAWMDELVQQYPQYLRIETYGESFEKRQMKAIILSKQPGNPGIFLESNIHAREWITSATTTWILNQLLTSTDPEVVQLATEYDWYILPVMNPDGLHYTKETNRLWRKNRSRQTILCQGVDMNRNFPGHWMEGGASVNPCSDLFAGPSAGSEIETQNVMALLRKYKSQIDFYMSFHSYGQYMLLPYGHQDAEHSENYFDWMQIAEAAAQAAVRKHGTQYTFGTTADVLYVASGSSPDWAHGQEGIPIGVTYEFRDTGYYGFVLPATQIIPNAEEVLDSLVAWMAKAKELGYFPRRDVVA